jgi:hypothetical protein
VRIRRYDVYAESGVLVVTRSRASALLDVAAVIGLFLLGVPGLVWAVSLFEPGRVAVALLVLAAVAAGVCAFLLMMRAYGGHRLGERLVLDRAADAVTRAGVRLCAMSELDCVELRRREGTDDAADVFAVALVVAGLRPRGAPRAGPSAFEDSIAVVESTSEGEMRTCASGLADYAAVRIEEIGW